MCFQQCFTSRFFILIDNDVFEVMDESNNYDCEEDVSTPRFDHVNSIQLKRKLSKGLKKRVKESKHEKVDGLDDFDSDDMK